MIVGLSDMFMNLSDMFDDQYEVRITYTPIRPRQHGKDHSHVSPFISPCSLVKPNCVADEWGAPSDVYTMFRFIHRIHPS
jgi:hypothetical protein